jgi:hypothetical protein
VRFLSEAFALAYKVGVAFRRVSGDQLNKSSGCILILSNLLLTILKPIDTHFDSIVWVVVKVVDSKLFASIK